MASSNRITEIEQELRKLEMRRHELLEELRSIKQERESPKLPFRPAVPRTSEEKIALFLALFGARRSVFPRLWENQRSGAKGYSPVCRNEWVGGVCEKPRVKCTACPNQNFAPLDHAAVYAHLTGQHTIGTYAIREDDTCLFLAADFDGDGWQEDILAYCRAGEELGVSIAIERSRSGNGGHAWIFFAQPVQSALARRLGTLIVAKATVAHPGMKLATYDRFFPNQDTLPNGGFGNLIALPLQQEPRHSGNTVFLDDHFQPHSDQWSYLAGLSRIESSEIQQLLAPMASPSSDSSEKDDASVPLKLDERALDVIPQAVNRGVFSGTLSIERKSQFSVPTAPLPPLLKAALKRLGTIANPIFYEKQRMRFPTFNIPRFIFCGEEHEDRLVLPRGTGAKIEQLIRKAGGKLKVSDRRPKPKEASFTFQGALSATQAGAVEAVLQHEEGVLVAPPGAGKTVMGCAAIAQRGVSTLILVHRKPLMDQWSERLQKFLGLSRREIHILGKSRYQSAPVALGMLQTVARSEVPGALLGDYTQIIIDECHHVPAASFEAAMKQCAARFILGLTATPTRKDGLQKILFLQCGPIRHTIKADHAEYQSRTVLVREFALRLPPEKERIPIHQLWEILTGWDLRNQTIASDVIQAHSQGRMSAVLSDRKDHLTLLESLIRKGIAQTNIFRIDGSTGRKQRKEVLEILRGLAESRTPFVLLATASLLGEGFDLPELDTLFLAMPISFKGRLIQYAGRLHRVSEGKNSVRIHDYVESDHPLTALMHRKRLAAYREMGYAVRIVGSELFYPSGPSQ